MQEFYLPEVESYQIGKTKYIIVIGTVMSGLGKGIFASSLAKILEMRGLKVAPVKFDGYLNQDAGTLNPFRHGEVYVLKDGTETDMDFGSYERILNCKIDKDNYLTGGKLFQKVLNKERKGKYLGRDVQIIPHVTGEIKLFLRNLAIKRNADVVIIEVGGTVGDFENGYFIEAMRQLAYEEGRENVFFTAMTYIIEPQFLGEQKSKAAQLGLRSLISMGIQPDMLVPRSLKVLEENIKQKLSVYSNVKIDNVIGLHDQKSVYYIPLFLKKNNVDKKIIDKLKLNVDDTNYDYEQEKLKEYIVKLENPIKNVTIGITGKYTKVADSYASIIKALEHAGNYHDVNINIKWIDTENLDIQELKDVNGIIVPGGFGSRGVEGKIECVKYARENNLPYLGICYGFQMALIEFARNVLHLDAHTTEVNKNTIHPVVCLLPEQMEVETKGGTMRLGEREIEIKKDTYASKIYNPVNTNLIKERFRHRYECNPQYIRQFQNAGLIFSGKCPDQPIMQILELPEHKFFVGVQYHPEFTSKVNSPNPLFRELIYKAMN